MPGTGFTDAPGRQALSDRLALKPYWGEPNVRNFRGGDGDVGIIRSPVRAIALPDRAQLTALERVAQLPRLDLTRLERDLTARLTEWRGVLSRHTAQARQLLRKLLVGRLTFAPETRADGRYVQITGTGTIAPIAAALGYPSSVASPRGIETSGNFDLLREFRAA